MTIVTLMRSGNLDGAAYITVAWMPDAEDLAKLNAGNPIFLSCIGGLPPHLVTSEFPVL